MKNILRTIAGIFVGLLVLFVLIIAVEAFSAVVHPFPPGFEGTQDEICAHVERYPGWVLAAVVPMWGATAFAAVWVAGKLGQFYAATFVGFLLNLALISNLAMLPYPLWFKGACLLLLPLATIGAVWLTPIQK
ncbi:hypothetical protein [Blastopirellula retiformator]|uniref:Uncharacterized protein n=1 Tax=Blastopirellula retiformator TaxID=2527970 RepID=A0A5C5USH2_9BACT|nr:hypothetical protein [Blastopirellula retiformator]TWT29411.1 hypothetical protein Enr8_49270 [Blastopirellula retiformator]